MRAELRAAVSFSALLIAGAPGGAVPRFVRVDPSSLAGVTEDELPGGGVAFADLDGDGHDDLIAVHSDHGIELRRSDTTAARLLPVARSPRPAGVDGRWAAMSVAPADLDGDGRVDLLLGASDGAWLLAGRPDGSFDDRTAFAFDGLSRPVSSFALADVDGDGLLDVHLVTYLVGADWPHARCAADVLFLQREGAWVRAELPDALHGAGCGFGAVWFDQDDDGDLDAWVANDFGAFTVPSHVWRNDGVDATGTLRLRDAQESVAAPVLTYAMGVAVGDVDGDGRLDVASSSIGRAPLHRALGGGRFADQSELMGTARSLGWTGTRMTWGVLLDDLDGDGATDLFEAGGFYPLDPAFGARRGESPTLFYPGGRAPWIEDTAAFAEHTRGGDYRGVATGDLDGDGSPDLALAGALGTDPLALRNASTGGPWLDVVTRGTVSPREARGSVVTLSCPGVARRTAVVPTGGNPGSMSAPRAFVSLAGCDRSRAALHVDWPSGARSTHPVGSGSVVVVTEPAWLTVDRAELVVGGDPREARAVVSVVPYGERGPLGAGHRVELTALTAGASVESLTVDADGTHRVTVSARTAGEAWFAITADGRALPRRVRLPVRVSGAGAVVRVMPAALSSARPVEVGFVPRRADGTAWGAGQHFAVGLDGASAAGVADDRGDGRYVARITLDAGRSTAVGVRLTAPDGEVTALRVPVVADVDPARTVADLRPALVASGDRVGSASLLTTLFTPLGDPLVATVPTLVDGRGTALGVGRAVESSSWMFAVADERLGDGPFTVCVGEAPASSPVSRQVIAARETLAAQVSATMSRLDPMEAVMEADGVSATGLVLRLADERGRIIALPDLPWEVEGGALDATEITTVDGSFVRRVVAGARAGTLSATVRVRGDLTLATTIVLARPGAEPVSSIELCASGSTIGEGSMAVELTAYPRAANGLLAGGHRDVTLTVDGASLPPVLGHGAYRARSIVDPRRGLRVEAVDQGSVVPARRDDTLAASLALPLTWQGAVSCVSARRPDGRTEGVEAGGCGVVPMTSSRGHGWALALAAIVGMRGRRRRIWVWS